MADNITFLYVVIFNIQENVKHMIAIFTIFLTFMHEKNEQNVMQHIALTYAVKMICVLYQTNKQIKKVFIVLRVIYILQLTRE